MLCTKIVCYLLLSATVCCLLLFAAVGNAFICYVRPCYCLLQFAANYCYLSQFATMCCYLLPLAVIFKYFLQLTAIGSHLLLVAAMCNYLLRSAGFLAVCCYVLLCPATPRRTLIFVATCCLCAIIFRSLLRFTAIWCYSLLFYIYFLHTTLQHVPPRVPRRPLGLLRGSQGTPERAKKQIKNHPWGLLDPPWKPPGAQERSWSPMWGPFGTPRTRGAPKSIQNHTFGPELNYRDFFL
jgi:hypothetical protein